MAPLRDTSVRYPGGRSAAWGLVGFVLSYLCFLGIVVVQRSTLVSGRTVSPGGGAVEEPLTEFVALGQLPDWELAGIVLFNAQFVPFEVPVQAFQGAQSITRGVNFLTAEGGLLLAAFALPVAAYVATGALAARSAIRAGRRNPALTAALQFTGVLPLVVVGMVAFGFSVGGSTGPSLLWTPVLAGFVYPVVCGYVGGRLGTSYWDTASGPGEPSDEGRDARDGWSS